MDYYKIANNSMGVYPAKFGDKDRTEWEDGWNAYKKELIDRVKRIKDYLKDKPALERMINSGTIDLSVDKQEIAPYYISSDIFAWGYADAEDLTEDELKEENLLKIEAAFNEDYGVVRFHCRRYNEKPQWPIEKDMRQAGCWDLEDLPDCRYDLEFRWKDKTRKEYLKELGYDAN